MSNKTIELINGVKIPTLGFGTWCIEGKKATDAVKCAIEVGYRHIDTAQAYGNEAEVADGILASGVDRNDLFVVSKVAAEHKTYELAAQSINQTLHKMKSDHLDMMIIHSPQPWAEWRGKKRYFEENIEVWRALEDAYRDGKLRAIGVSNFLEDDLDNILSHCGVKPAVNQVLAHIGNMPFDLINKCQKEGIAVEAYSPIAHGEALKNPTIAKIAQNYGVSAAQLCIKYVLQHGLIALPKASTLEHIKQNAELNFDISASDMSALDGLDFSDYGQYSYFPVFSGK